MRKWFVFLLGGLILCFAGVSCKDDSKKDGDETKTGPCSDVGVENTCTCESGASGTQICDVDEYWTDCACAADTASSAVEGSDEDTAETDVTCTEGAQRCRGNVLEQCLSGEWRVWNDCATSGETCTQVGGVYQCVSGATTDSATSVDSSVVDTGTATAVVGPCMYTCSEHCYSIGGQPMDGTCEEGYKCCDLGVEDTETGSDTDTTQDTGTTDTATTVDTYTDSDYCAYTCSEHCRSIGGTPMDGYCEGNGFKCCDLGPIDTETATDTATDTEDSETTTDTLIDTGTAADDCAYTCSEHCYSIGGTVMDGTCAMEGYKCCEMPDTETETETETEAPCAYTCSEHCASIGGTVMDGTCETAGDKCCDLPCDPDYVEEDGVCIHQKIVACADNAPSHGTSISGSVVIEYSDADGWEDPADCDWECDANYGQVGDTCLDSREVSCNLAGVSPPPNAQVIAGVNVTITYTDADGWSDPADCDWECITDYTYEGSACIHSMDVDCNSDNTPNNATADFYQVEITYSTAEGGWEDAEACTWSCDTDYFELDGACINEDTMLCHEPTYPPSVTNAHWASDEMVTITYTTDGGWTDPEDCEWACDADYDLVGGECIDSQVVACNDAAPANATSTVADVTITYTDADGWTDPADCVWECDSGYTQDGDACVEDTP